MAEKKRKVDWTTERIAQLSKAEISALLQNAKNCGENEVALRCEQALQSSAHAPGRWAMKRRGGTSVPFSIPENAQSEVENLILGLPLACDVPNARNRLELQASPIRALDDLWWQYITCGLSSLEHSDEDSPLGRFVKLQGPILQLAEVLKHNGDVDWIERELRPHLTRRIQSKILLIAGAHRHFSTLGKPSELLAKIPESTSALNVFFALAKGEVNDKDLASSGAFSRALDATALPSVSHKQIRNILVNSGLARNVLPLDSRWQNFFGAILPIDSKILSNKGRYLAIEDLMRRALLAIQSRRPDIPNLAVLDAIVFAHMSPQGASMKNWAGSKR